MTCLAAGHPSVGAGSLCLNHTSSFSLHLSDDAVYHLSDWPRMGGRGAIKIPEAPVG